MRRIFGLATGIQPYDHVPAELLNKTVIGKVLVARAKQVKFPVAEFARAAISDGGDVIWAVGYPWAFHWHEGKLQKILHYCGGDYVFDAEEVVTERFTLHQVWDLNNAKLQKGAICYKLKDLYPEGAQVRQLTLSKKAVELKALADEVIDQIEKSKRDAEQHVVDESVVVLKDTAIVESRRRAAAAARDKITSSKKARCGEISLSAIACITTT